MTEAVQGERFLEQFLLTEYSSNITIYLIGVTPVKYCNQLQFDISIN